MYVVKQCCNYIQYYHVCTIRLYGYMIIQGIWSFRHLVSKKCKGCGYNVIFFLLFLLWFQNGLFLILDLSSITDGGYMYIYSCELIRHTSSKVIRWNFYTADDTAFDNRFVQLLYFSLLVLLKWLLQYLQPVSSIRLELIPRDHHPTHELRNIVTMLYSGNFSPKLWALIGYFAVT